jgi:hypothetical protein
MSEEEVQRFEYRIWFKGSWIPPKNIADVISSFILFKNAEILNADYGTTLVPIEDAGSDRIDAIN